MVGVAVTGARRPRLAVTRRPFPSSSTRPRRRLPAAVETQAHLARASAPAATMGAERQRPPRSGRVREARAGMVTNTETDRRLRRHCRRPRRRRLRRCLNPTASRTRLRRLTFTTGIHRTARRCPRRRLCRVYLSWALRTTMGTSSSHRNSFTTNHTHSIFSRSIHLSTGRPQAVHRPRRHLGTHNHHPGRNRVPGTTSAAFVASLSTQIQICKSMYPASTKSSGRTVAKVATRSLARSQTRRNSMFELHFFEREKEAAKTKLGTASREMLTYSSCISFLYFFG
jgi:hypothetical protein